MDHLIPADDEVFYTRNDPNDIRFGDIVLRDIDQYSTAQVVILGCPQDEGISRNRGRPGARFAPTEIRRDLYRYPVTQLHKHLILMDLGDLRAAGVGMSLQSIIDTADPDGIFFGFDLDAVRSIEAPGVSDPGPMGFTAREVCEIADVAASDPRTRIIEITEVCPEFDRDRLTSKLAANIIVRALAKDTGGKFV